MYILQSKCRSKTSTYTVEQNFPEISTRKKNRKIEVGLLATLCFINQGQSKTESNQSTDSCPREQQNSTILGPIQIKINTKAPKTKQNQPVPQCGQVQSLWKFGLLVYDLDPIDSSGKT